MKGNLWKILFAFSSLCIIVGAVGLWMTYNNPLKAAEERTLLQQQTFDITGITDLKISADLASIRLKEGSAEEVEVYLYGKRAQEDFGFQIERSRHRGQPEVLELQIITENGPRLNLNSLFDALRTRDARFSTMAEVHIPSYLFETLEVTTMVGNIEVSQLLTDKLVVKSELGKIDLADVQGNDITVESSVGEIYLVNIEAPLKVKSNVGKVSWVTPQPEHPVDIRTDVGNVELKLHPNPATLELEVLLGTIQTDSLNGLTRIEREDGTYVHGSIGNGGPLIKVLTHVGSIHAESVQ